MTDAEEKNAVDLSDTDGEEESGDEDNFADFISEDEEEDSDEVEDLGFGPEIIKLEADLEQKMKEAKAIRDKLKVLRAKDRKRNPIPYYKRMESKWTAKIQAATEARKKRRLEKAKKTGISKHTRTRVKLEDTNLLEQHEVHNHEQENN